VNSDDVKLGEWVLAVGNPFNLNSTVTAGIVSAKSRNINILRDQYAIESFIQTDAAINPGNSGGPLLDSAGRLIGINTAIYSPSGAYAGIGFAVPVDTVNRVVPELITRGRYIRPSLGVGVDADINQALSKQLGVEGVLLLTVEAGSAADVAGLRGTRVDRDGDIIPGDIIVALNGQAVDSVTTLWERLDDHRVGDRVRLRIWRRCGASTSLIPISGRRCNSRGYSVSTCAKRSKFLPCP